MDTTKLGRTGLTVSVAGLGCGGNSRLGLGRGLPHSQCVGLVRAALDHGVNFLDTAEAYGTEEIVGEAVRAVDRRGVVISTKSRYARAGALLSVTDVIDNLDGSLRRLQTDYVDVFHVHAVKREHYAYVASEIVPALMAERDKGKLRYLGITESPPSDPDQAMLQRAIQDDVWDVMMLGFHMMHQGAGRTVLPVTAEKGIGTLIMFAVRNIFSRPDELRETLSKLAADGAIPTSLAAASEPLDFLIHDDGARSLTDAAYRFARHQSGVDVVLFGTGNVAHLEQNIASICAPPLPETDVQTIHDWFGELTGIGLDLPDRVQARA
ncbi:MAG: aldo/keto reductase [Pseudomonadota bacterium]